MFPRAGAAAGACLAFFALAAIALDGRTGAAAAIGHIGLLAPPAALCVVVARRRGRWQGAQRLFWDVIAVGAALWIAGHLGWTFDALFYGRQNWLAWHSVFTLAGGLAPLIALLARPYLGPRAAAARQVSFEMAVAGLLAIFLFAYFVLVPGLVLPPVAVEPSLFAFVHGGRLLLAAAAVLSLAAAWRTPWRATFACLAAATVAGAALRFFASAAIARDVYAPGSIYDLAWIVPWLGILLGAVAAPISESVRAGAGRRPRRRAVRLAVPVALIPLVGYGWLFVHPLAPDVDGFRALLTGVLTVAGIGMLTIRLAAQGAELVHADSRLRLLAAATEQTADLIVIVRADGSIEHANEAFLRTLGYDRAELAGCSWADLMDPAFAETAVQIRREVDDLGIWRGTILRRRRDESIFPSACTVVALKDEGAVTHYVAVERDVSEDIRLREQLVHSERLNAIGELVAGVAHEINNPLQTIIGSVELLMEERPDEGTRRDLQIVRREATRAAQIVRNLISFVRRGGTDRVPADLNQLVQATADIREFHLQQRSVSLQLDLAPTPLDVLVNREEIQQALLNLLLNAEQAVLSTGQPGAISLRTFQSGEFHVLEIGDTGPGVPAHLGGRIFEPFFTTRPVGEGTGLGLSISHGIAASHGGTLELRPAARGATFRLAIPAMPSVEPVRGVPMPAATRPVALVVDDEAPIRRLLVRLLERRGYAAFEAPSGQVALALALEHPPDVVLCDVRMPGMTGPELYRTLYAGEPKPKRFVFITGDRTAVHEGEPAFADVPVLAKPFTAAALDAVLTTPSRR